MSAGEFDDVEHRLDEVEQWLVTADDADGTEMAPGTRAVVVDV